MLGRIVPHKRIEHGIQMLADLRRGGLDAVLDVVGSCHNAVYAGYLQEQALSLGVTDSVHMWGMLSDPEVAERFAQASLLLVASEHEGFCVPVLEAMHLGVAAVVREDTAAGEVGAEAVRSYAGIAQGAELLRRIAAEPGLRAAMVKSGRSRAAKLLHEASVDVWRNILPGAV
jgi:glycosyltransferase involved in cell wall biosynthesis